MTRCDTVNSGSPRVLIGSEPRRPDVGTRESGRPAASGLSIPLLGRFDCRLPLSVLDPV